MSFGPPGSVHRRDWNTLFTPKGALVSPFTFNGSRITGGSGSITSDGRTFNYVNSGASAFSAVWQRTTANKTGKFYWEIQTSSMDGGRGFYLGIIRQTTFGSPVAGNYPISPIGVASNMMTNVNYFGGLIGVVANGVNSANSACDWTTQRIGIAVNFGTGHMWFRKAEAWLSGDPAADTGFLIGYGGFDQDIYCSIYGRSSHTYAITIYPDSADWIYTPPAGFTVLP